MKNVSKEHEDGKYGYKNGKKILEGGENLVKSRYELNADRK